MKKNWKMKFKVSHDLPLPAPYTGPGAKYDWPFGTMKIGDHFLFPIEGDGAIKAIYTARHIVMRNAREWRITGRRFATRLMPGDKFIGVWRIA
jgi:hypothetical protein